MRHDHHERNAPPSLLARTAPLRVRLLVVWLTGTLLWGLVAAQGLSGRFVGDSEYGSVTLTLETTSQGLVGVLDVPGVRLALDGEVSDGVGFGYARSEGDVLGFEAYVDGDVVGLYVFQLDTLGNALVETAIEFILTRAAAAAQPEPRSPFATTPPAASAVDGVYADSRITLDLRSAPGGYVGEVGTSDQRYTLEAVAIPGGMRGSFSGNGFVYDFVATFDNDAVRFETRGTVYDLVRQRPASTGIGAPSGSNATILARGNAADLSLDDAMAFLDAFEFVLEQVGYANRLTEAERTGLLQELAQSYPSLPPQDQAVLAQTRQIWERVQVRWPSSNERDRREFMLGVLVLAFGQETVSAWVGPQGSGGQGRGSDSGLGCTTFDECTSKFVDEQTWTDTFNAQGCWASAGCESFDPGTNSFTYSNDW